MPNMQQMIMLSAIKQYEKSGVKFKMEDIAKSLSISKKSIYEYFDSKEILIASCVDYVFEDISNQQDSILSSSEPSYIKLRKLLSVYPEMFNIAGNNLEKLDEFYPDIHSHILARLHSNWEPTLNTLASAISDGYFAPVDPEPFRLMLISIFDSLLLVPNRQEELLDAYMNILFNGLLIR